MFVGESEPRPVSWVSVRRVGSRKRRVFEHHVGEHHDARIGGQAECLGELLVGHSLDEVVEIGLWNRARPIGEVTVEDLDGIARAHPPDLVVGDQNRDPLHPLAVARVEGVAARGQ